MGSRESGLGDGSGDFGSNRLLGHLWNATALDEDQVLELTLVINEARKWQGKMHSKTPASKTGWREMRRRSRALSASHRPRQVLCLLINTLVIT